MEASSQVFNKGQSYENKVKQRLMIGADYNPSLRVPKAGSLEVF